MSKNENNIERVRPFLTPNSYRNWIREEKHPDYNKKNCDFPLLSPTSLIIVHLFHNHWLYDYDLHKVRLTADDRSWTILMEGDKNGTKWNKRTKTGQQMIDDIWCCNKTKWRRRRVVCCSLVVEIINRFSFPFFLSSFVFHCHVSCCILCIVSVFV